MGFLTKHVFCLMVVAIAIAQADEDYQYDYAYDDGDYTNDDQKDEVIEEHPTFVTLGSTFTFDRGNTIRLPCYVDKLPKNYVLFWKKVTENDGETLISVDTQIVDSSSTRESVEISYDGADRGSTLVINLAEDQDAGQYMCVMGNAAKTTIKHTVKIRAPPQITKQPANGLLLAQKGDTVTLSCKGQGKPEPKITWTRRGKSMPSGEKTIEASELTFTNVGRRHSGTYICTADNGFSQEVQDKIEVEVEYQPDVEVEEVFIHASTGNQVELVCLVHAHPKPLVKWFRDSTELTNQSSNIRHTHNRHILIISELADEDFGNYTCSAENKWGQASRVIEISGLAAPAEFSSQPRGYEPEQYLIEWTVKSFSPVEEFLLRYRSHDDSEWQEVQIESTEESTQTYAGKRSLSGLSSASQYEAVVLAKNGQGWSRPSAKFQFATFGAEPLTDASSATSVSWSAFITLLSALISITGMTRSC
ncbi:lachesin-like isoform X2 [Tigriopus californicus]|uniref:lachesin-like isoform X2 n=1 Tax=Tigriopus californicus TaxID=6832 RepID=UPI0027DA290D|nr:lachesin-like isoform X2 [Tigriopus californicus]